MGVKQNAEDLLNHLKLAITDSIDKATQILDRLLFNPENGLKINQINWNGTELDTLQKGDRQRC